MLLLGDPRQIVMRLMMLLLLGFGLPNVFAIGFWNRASSSSSTISAIGAAAAATASPFISTTSPEMHRVNWGQRLVDPQEIFDRATEAVRSLTSGNTTCHLSVVDTMQHVCRTVQGNQPISDDLHLQIDAMALRTVICDRAIEHLQTPQACLNLNYLKPETIYQCLEVAQQNGAVWVSYMSHRSHLDAICTASSLATSQATHIAQVQEAMQSFFDAVGSLRTAMNQASQLAEMLDREIESQEALLSKLQTERAAILEDFQDIKATAGHAKAIATESVELQNSLHSAVRLANGNLLDFARSMWAQVSASMETHLADVRRIQDQTETIALRVGGALANMTVMEDRMSGIGSNMDHLATQADGLVEKLATAITMVAWFERNFGTAKGLFLALLLALLCAKFRSWTFVCLVALAVGSCLLASLLRLVVPGLADLIALGASLGSALQVWWAEALCFFLACLFLGFVRRELGKRAKARKILAEAPYDPASPPFRG